MSLDLDAILDHAEGRADHSDALRADAHAWRVGIVQLLGEARASITSLNADLAAVRSRSSKANDLAAERAQFVERIRLLEATLAQVKEVEGERRPEPIEDGTEIERARWHIFQAANALQALEERDRAKLTAQRIASQ